jgi:CheY-like chemotaxis protein
MTKPAPVIIVDDDQDEHDLMKEVWKELNMSYPLISFFTGEQLLDYLQSDEQTPFLIISDINLHPIDGFELREKILEDESSKFKSIPFIFWSGSATEDQIKKAYDLSSHGFFIKASTFEELREILKDIIAYWQKSEIPYLRGQY